MASAQQAVKVHSMDGKGTGCRPESHATVAFLLESLIKDGATWQVAFPSHKYYSSTSIERHEQSSLQTFQLGLLGFLPSSVL